MNSSVFNDDIEMNSDKKVSRKGDFQ